ncbi:hypothetical protein HPB49_013508 [Dermacentor silvarum]|uniref:Uncharacterized protein n=1 Tax=Dermacentor silvarum TaxID=543639 RepID=A0ACB8C9L2_DERSI|nr:hypothetical protein HPB49_013508 [Dermacentor silvarum]
MEVKRVGGEVIQQEDFNNEAGWCEIRRRNIRKTSRVRSGPTKHVPRDTAASKRAPGDSKWKSQRSIRPILPYLPAEGYKGGLNVSDHRHARIYCCLRNAAGVGHEAAQE